MNIRNALVDLRKQAVAVDAYADQQSFENSDGLRVALARLLYELDGAGIDAETAKRTCIWCGAAMDGHRPHAVVCSGRCRTAYGRYRKGRE